MKITKRQLKRIIEEAVQKTLNENEWWDPGVDEKKIEKEEEEEDIQPGDYLEISVPANGRNTHVRKLSPAEYQNTKDYHFQVLIFLMLKEHYLQHS